jgi:hypothetical protein
MAQPADAWFGASQKPKAGLQSNPRKRKPEKTIVRKRLNEKRRMRE